RSVTISGEADQIKAFLAWLRRNRRIAGVALDVQIPYHSPAVEPLRRRLLEDLKGLRPAEGGVLYASSTTGQIAHGMTLDADYWWRNARDVVRFEEAVEALCEAGCHTFVEISPRPVLANYVKDRLRALGHAGACVRTMDQGTASDASAAAMAALAYAEGARLDTARFFGPKAPAAPDLPAYPWANATFRAEPTPDAANNWGLLDFHPLIGRAAFPGQTVWQGDVNPRTLDWLADHVVDGAIVFPAAGFVEMALAAGRRMLGHERIELSDFEILRPLVLGSAGAADIRTSADPATGLLRIEARPRLGEGEWALHAFGTIRALPSPRLPEIARVAGDAMGAEALYPLLARHGLEYGPRFRLADAAASAGGRATARIRAEDGPADPRFLLNPTHLDAGMHAVLPIALANLDGAEAADSVFLPVRFGRVRLARAGAAAAEVRIEITKRTTRGIELTLVLLDGAGATIAAIEGLRFQEARLRGRGLRDLPLWRQRLVQLRAPDRNVALPKGWAMPANRLRALGIAAEEEPEPDAGALLLDAACRRILWDACQPFADATGRVPPLPADLAAAAWPLFERLLAALEEDGLASPEEGGTRFAAACPYPALDALVASLAGSAPERAADLLDLMRLETTLPALLRDGLRGEAPAAGGIDLSASQRAIWAHLARVAADLASAWPAGERLNFLFVGAVPASLVSELGQLPQIDQIVVTAASERQVDLLRRTLPRSPALQVLPLAQALEPLRHDVVIAANALLRLPEEERGRLADSIALAGLLVAAEEAPSLARDLREGLVTGFAQAAWRRERPDWGSLLAAGFRDIAEQPLATSSVEAAILTARPRQQAVRATLPVLSAKDPRDVLLVLSDRRRQSLHLAALVEASLSAAGIAVRRCLAGEDFGLQETASEVIHLAHLAEPDDEAMTVAGRRIAILRDILALAQRPKRIWIVTQGGRPGCPGPAAPRLPAEAALWGATRVLTNEYPDTRFHLVDFAPGVAAEALAEDLCSLIVSGTTETEITIHGGGLFAPRVEPGPLPPPPASGGEALRLEIGQQGALDTLEWRRVERRTPGPSEVEIEVRATGLNFRDLMWAQGLLPEEALQDGFAGATLGMECSGIVVRAGRDSGFRRGDEVIAFSPSSLATHVTVQGASVARLPAGTSFETAASLPTIFVTAHYALRSLAGLRAGEILLVHGGAGGVGLAALQIARRIGARVFATAGSPAKRRLLEHLGAEQVFDSRSLAFADEVMEATGGEGVDVVLNALAGEAAERSLACLRPFGRFIELGKRDFYANTRLGLRPFRRNLSYFAVDADQLLRQRGDIADRLFAEIAEGFAAGHYAPPPCQIFEAAEIVDALRFMQQSRHVGKIVVRAPAPPE
ncbi:MAG TPA: zinc-binding dehydrogenase, partial [Paracoccaceae bacterium]|nr:zinc-binding dehydrogenase [Paracoccaceae bacterium]